MTVFINKHKDVVIVLARAESPGSIGDAIWIIKPNESLLGHSYEWWEAQPIGRKEIDTSDAQIQSR